MDRRKPGIAWTEANRETYPQLIEEFRFYTPHITKFFDDYGELIKEYPPVPIFKIPVAEIQPSQFFIDEDKIAAIRSFIHCSQDIIVQVMRHNGRYISLDGHTRLYYAVLEGWDIVRAVEAEVSEDILDFVKEAQRRKIYAPKDMELVGHSEYEEKWNRFCDAYFGK